MAASRSIGNVYAELSVKDKMSVGINKASRSLAAFGSKLASIGTTAALAAPAAAFAGVTVAMKSAIDAGGQLADMMARTGAEGKGLFVMQRAFENAGVSGDKVATVLNKLQKSMIGMKDAGGANALTGLGLNVEKLLGMDPAEAFRTISEAIAKLPDPAQRAAVAMEIFGKSGGELLAIMNDVGAFEVAEKQVGKLGQFLADNAANLDKLGDSLSLMGSKAVEIGAAFAVELQPELQKFADWIGALDLIDDTKQFIEFSKAVYDVADALAEVGRNAVGFDGIKSYFAKPLAWAAGFNPTEGQALPTPDVMIGGRPPNYDGIMLPQKSIKDFTTIIPEWLQRQPTLVAETPLEDLGIPGLADIINAIQFSAGPAAMESKAKPAADFSETSYDVNEMQRRGLGFGGMDVAKKANEQVGILKQIRDLLKKERELTWT